MEYPAHFYKTGIPAIKIKEPMNGAYQNWSDKAKAEVLARLFAWEARAIEAENLTLIILIIVDNLLTKNR